MCQNLQLYHISDEYVNYLRIYVDETVEENKQDGFTRPYIGIVIKIKGADFFAPLSSKIKKSNDGIMLIPNRLTKQQKEENDKTKEFPEYIGIIKFNAMIPVYEDVITPVDLKNVKNNKKDENYRNLLVKEALFCSENKDKIIKKCAKLYKNYLEQTPYMKPILDNCCKFLQLIDGMDKYKEIHTQVTSEAACTLE